MSLPCIDLKNKFLSSQLGCEMEKILTMTIVFLTNDSEINDSCIWTTMTFLTLMESLSQASEIVFSIICMSVDG